MVVGIIASIILCVISLILSLVFYSFDKQKTSEIFLILFIAFILEATALLVIFTVNIL